LLLFHIISDRFIFDKTLWDLVKIKMSEIADGIDSLLFVSLCLLGKVHGSLARAGKVKGQTPKVCIFLS